LNANKDAIKKVGDLEYMLYSYIKFLGPPKGPKFLKHSTWDLNLDVSKERSYREHLLALLVVLG
jgi:hypothetical protein